jgi:hypothetical protein
MRLMLALGFVIALTLTSTPTAIAQGASVIWVNEPKPGQLPDGVSEYFDPTKPDTYPNNHLGPDKQNYINNDAFLLLKKNKAEECWEEAYKEGHAARGQTPILSPVSRSGHTLC